METYELPDLPASLPNEQPVREARRGFFQNLINFFQERAVAKREKQEEKAFRDRVINFTRQINQEPKATFIAGGPTTIDLSQVAPGTIYRAEALKVLDAALVEKGEEELTDSLKYYFWFIKAGRDQVYKIHGVVGGEETNNPSTQPRLKQEDEDLKYKLVKTSVSTHLFKPADVLKVVYISEKNASNGFIHPEVSSDPNKYLHELYKVLAVDVMETGSFDGISADKSDVVDTVRVVSNETVLQPSGA